MEKKKMKIQQRYKEAKEEKIEMIKDLQEDEMNCLKCKIKMVKYRESKSLFNGASVFHFIKFKCPQCKKEYLDLEEAKKYDLYLKSKKNGKQEALSGAAHEKTKEMYIELK